MVSVYRYRRDRVFVNLVSSQDGDFYQIFAVPSRTEAPSDQAPSIESAAIFVSLAVVIFQKTLHHQGVLWTALAVETSHPTSGVFSSSFTTSYRLCHCRLRCLLSTFSRASSVERVSLRLACFRTDCSSRDKVTSEERWQVSSTIVRDVDDPTVYTRAHKGRRALLHRTIR